jgi:hypothetical protein
MLQDLLRFKVVFDEYSGTICLPPVPYVWGYYWIGTYCGKVQEEPLRSRNVVVPQIIICSAAHPGPASVIC